MQYFKARPMTTLHDRFGNHREYYWKVQMNNDKLSTINLEVTNINEAYTIYIDISRFINLIY